MEEIKDLLRSLTHTVCSQLEGAEIPKSTLWTVVDSPDAPPHVAMDLDRPVLSDLLFSLSIRLLHLPEYEVAAEAIESNSEFREGIVVDAGGFLRKPERTNITRALLTNFLRRYLREGEQLDWDESRFDETFNELRAELHRKSVVSHTTLPLSNLKMGVASLDFSSELRLLPASIKELERWINPDRSLPPFGTGPPQWSTHHVDKPAVLHAHKIVVGRLPSTDPQEALEQLPRVNTDLAITALRLILNTPISIIFQENRLEGMMAFTGTSTSWGRLFPTLGPVVTLDQEKATQVIHVWHLLQTSSNIDRVRLPLRRWESSLLRQSLEDKLIDAWISLEALILGGQDGELSFRAAVLLAEFLGTSGTDRKVIYDATRISYKWRSAIVHGSSTKKLAKLCPLQETVRITTEYLRSALLRVLELPGRFNPTRFETDLLSRESGSPGNQAQMGQ